MRHNLYCPSFVMERSHLAMVLVAVFIANLVGAASSEGDSRGWRRPKKTGEPVTIVLPGGEHLDLMWCPSGKFIIGEGNWTHEVTLTKGFWIGRYEVTQDQWKSVMGDHVSYHAGERQFKDGRLPVELVSWEDCQEFCRKAGWGLRLPTEAEWEYACRAGTRGDFSGLVDDVAWHLDDGAWTRRVGTKSANAWGIHDMHGNVWEWCQDWLAEYPNGPMVDPRGAASGEHRVARGGAVSLEFALCRAAIRGHAHPKDSNNMLGFRVACSLDTIVERIYTVKPGDDVLSVAIACRINPLAILELNGIEAENSDRLIPGQILRLPEEARHLEFRQCPLKRGGSDSIDLKQKQGGRT